MAPGPSLLNADIRPPWASTIDRQTDSPMPSPLDLVVKKALNRRLAFSVEMPIPLSVTLRTTWPVSSLPDQIKSSPGRSVIGSMASMPFIKRLMTTCCS